MVIAKLSRPCSSPKDSVLVLYCSPLVISDVLKDLSPSDVLDTSIEFINVILPND